MLLIYITMKVIICAWKGSLFILLSFHYKETSNMLTEMLWIENKADGTVLYNGADKKDNKFFH